MKKINKITIYSLLAVAVAIGGCKKDFLEVAPTTAINAKEAFSSAEKISAALTGIYDISSIGDFKYNMILNNDIKGGDVMIVSGAANYNRFVTGYQFIETASSNEPNYYWTYGFRLINNANQFEEYIPTSPLTDAQKTAYLAEIRALRAETYFWLIQWFAKPYNLDPEAMGLPILVKPVGPQDPGVPRAKVKEVYAQIITDLKFAEANLPATKTSIYRVTKASIQGVLARVYLTMGNYPEASSYAKLARAAKPLSSANDLLAGFRNPTSEWIYAVNSRTDDNAGFITVNSFYDPYDVGYSSFRVSKSFLDSFAANDERKKQFLIKDDPEDPTSAADYGRRGEGWLINKFDFLTTPAQNQVLMRSSEMYLIEAEAEAMQGGANEAAAKVALQAIQQRAMPGAALSANTGQALVKEILAERSKELYGEGFKYFDLLRTKQPVTRIADSANGGHWSAVNFQPGDNKLAMPIPLSELQANPALKPQQNPGYAN